MFLCYEAEKSGGVFAYAAEDGARTGRGRGWRSRGFTNKEFTEWSPILYRRKGHQSSSPESPQLQRKLLIYSWGPIGYRDILSEKTVDGSQIHNVLFLYLLTINIMFGKHVTA